MLKLLAYLCSKGVVTSRSFCPPLEEGVRGLPLVTPAACIGSQCNTCQDVCPTNAITVSEQAHQSSVAIDLGACIGCGLCTAQCPTGTIVNDKATKTARLRREELVIGSEHSLPKAEQNGLASKNIFRRSIAIRVVSTGCSACDLEIGAAGNPIFDMERFGVHVVASPRFADVLAVTGPVPQAMHDPLRRCYEAMAEPRHVIAVGSCAISGGVHKNGYTNADGVDKILPVDVYIPGCPPHPWSIIDGILLAMGRADR
jgi:Ni,Fe-hydrogenase III small subunit/NAD-dependent dihydropyrimidine dehydrogenase PreA subunit